MNQLNFKAKLVCLILTFCTFFTYAQDPQIAKYNWEKEMKMAIPTDDEKAEEAVVILDYRVEDYFSVQKEFSQKILVQKVKLQHKIVYLNSDKAVEEYNKVYVPFDSKTRIDAMKARCIGPDGKVTELDKSTIKELKDLGEKSRNYKIFAIEGAVKGSTIEYLYRITDTSPSWVGRVSLTDEHPTREFSLEVNVPKGFEFVHKTYNAQFIESFPYDQDIIVKRTNLPGMKEEAYGDTGANIPTIVYKMNAYSNGSNRQSLLTDKDFAGTIWDRLRDVSNRSFTPKIDKFIKKMEWEKLKTESEKIKAVENYIKTNIAVRNDAEASKDYNDIIKQKYASETGLQGLYSYIFDYLRIGYDPGYTCPREAWHLDKTFNDYTVYSDFLFYFPSSKGYLFPDDMIYRFPYPSYRFEGNLCKLASTETSVYYRFIDPTPIEFTKENTDIRVTVNTDDETVVVNKKMERTGHHAFPYRKVLSQYNEEEQKENVFKYMASGMDDAKKISVAAQNVLTDSLVPLLLSAEFEAASLLEKAGQNYILNIGKVIGKQSELYQETERKQDIHHDYKNAYHHEIRVTLPEGYKVTNLEQATITRLVPGLSGENLMSFHSEAKQEGNSVVIKVDEQYNKTELPASLYPEYRSLINGAADFNKVVLVLEKL